MKFAVKLEKKELVVFEGGNVGFREQILVKI